MMINTNVIIVLFLLNTAARVLLSNMSNTSILVAGFVVGAVAT